MEKSKQVCKSCNRLYNKARVKQTTLLKGTTAQEQKLLKLCMIKIKTPMVSQNFELGSLCIS